MTGVQTCALPIWNDGINQFAVHRLGRLGESFQGDIPLRFPLLKPCDIRLLHADPIGELSGIDAKRASDRFDPARAWRVVGPQRDPRTQLLFDQRPLADEVFSVRLHTCMMLCDASNVNVMMLYRASYKAFLMRSEASN